MISKTAEYALRAVTCLAAAPSRAMSADAMAEVTKVPRRYLTRVMQDLAAAEVVGSKSGPGGGYLLSQEIEQLSVLDVINAVSPLERIRECPLGIESHTELCPLHAVLDEAYAKTEAAFEGVTLKQLIESTNPVAPLCSA
ncbi:MAG: Rrf2 family transcriptional regulator [Planctomycetota bacterium]